MLSGSEDGRIISGEVSRQALQRLCHQLYKSIRSIPNAWGLQHPQLHLLPPPSMWSFLLLLLPLPNLTHLFCQTEILYFLGNSSEKTQEFLPKGKSLCFEVSLEITPMHLEIYGYCAWRYLREQ